MPVNDSPASHGLSRLKRSATRGATRPWKPFFFTLLTLGLFALVAARLFGDRLRPAVKVETARALPLPSGAESEAAPAPSSTGILFQSSGWIEADPWHVRVPALVDGIVESVHFREGDEVREGQLLARLDSEEIDLEVERLQREVRLAELEAAVHDTAVEAAEQERLAAGARGDRAAAALAEARDDWERVRALIRDDVLSKSQTTAAEQRFRQSQAGAREAESHMLGAELEVKRRRQAAEVQTQRVRSVETRLDGARLIQNRMEIRSPMNGRVQDRLVEPGSKRMRGMDDPASATVALLYDPGKLQVRVDVPLAEAGQLKIDQPATVTTALLPGREFQGVVTRIVGEADLQRNTLQAKVALQDPDPRLRPETLCRVAFHVPPPTDSPATAGGTTGGEALWIPAGLAGVSGDAAELWVVDPRDQTVSLRAVTFGSAVRDGLRRVREGLRANESVVVNSARPLKPGDRVKRINP